MAKYLLKLSGSNNIEGIIEWDGVSQYTVPPGYVVELATTTSSINYTPSSSLYTDPVFGGKLFGEFEGDLINPTFDGETLYEVLNKTPYGTVTLYTSSVDNVFINSGSFKIEIDSSNNINAYFSLFNDEKNNLYSSSFAYIIDNNITNYTINLFNTQKLSTSIKFLIDSTEVSSSISQNVNNDFIVAKLKNISLIEVGDNNVFSLRIPRTVVIIDTLPPPLKKWLEQNYLENFNIDFEFNDVINDITDEKNKSTKYGKLLYNGYINDTDPGSGSFSINSSTVWSEATQLYVSLENYEKNTELSSSKSKLYESTLNDIFYNKIVGSKIKLESDVYGDNTYKIFEIEDINIVTSSGDNYAKLSVIEEDSYTSGNVLLALGQKFNVDFDFLNKEKRQIDIITGSKSFYTPYWAKNVIVMTIGAGGGGGGGITAKTGHQFAVGGAGGSGGSISYSEFNNLSGSVRIDCFIGKGGEGGTTGSSAITASYGKLCAICKPLDFVELSGYVISNIETGSGVITVFDILDQHVPTASFGYSGGTTFAYVYHKDYTSLIGKVYAPGGIGGSCGFSIGITGSISSSLALDLIVSNSIFPISLPGGTNTNINESFGDSFYYGGPGGHGISLPIFENNIYSNHAPSLPWKNNSITNSNQKLLKLPYGISDDPSVRRIYGINNNPDDIIVYLNQNKIPLSINKIDALQPNPLTGSYFNYNIPTGIGITGGGGGTGWTHSNLVQSSIVQIGLGGLLNYEDTIFEYELSLGGNGGNNSTLNSLSVQLPQTGSGPGAGGGGGASDENGGISQNGANGQNGAVVVISIG